MTDRILELRSRGILYVSEIKRRRHERERRSLPLCEANRSQSLSPIKLKNSVSSEIINGHSSILINQEKFEADLSEISFQETESVNHKEELLTFFEDHSVIENLEKKLLKTPLKT